MKNIIKKLLGIDKFEDKLDKYKECEKCGSLCQKDRMKEIKTIDGIFFGEFEKYYCIKCAPYYDKIVFESQYDGIYASSFKKPNKKYYKNNVEVNEKGKPICTKK